MCSVKVWRTSRFCWNCKSDQSKVGPPSWKDSPLDQQSSTGITENSPTPISIPSSQCASAFSKFGQPGFSNQKYQGKSMSFDEFVKNKTRKSAIPPKKKTKVEVKENAMINIGLKTLNDDVLKTVWGKRLPLLVPRDATYSLIREKAVAKWSAFDCTFDGNQEYVVTYDDGREAQFMPGGCKDFFSLQQYKQELGKDYKRITLYLCPSIDFKKANGLNTSESEAFTLGDDIDLPPFILDDNFSVPGSGLLLDIEPINKDMQSDHAKEHKDENALLTESEQLNFPKETPSSGAATSTKITEAEMLNEKNVLTMLQAKVNKEKQFFLVLRRGAPLLRVLKLWQRQSLIAPPTCTLCVKFNGELGIDTGAISKEFLELTIEKIRKEIFPGGAPKVSTFHVQNGTFRICGEIAAVCLAQNGPPPCFLGQCSYDALFKETDMMNVKDTELTQEELEKLSLIRTNVKEHTDSIVDSNYTGRIDDDHIEEILRSVKVTFVNERALCMREFGKGLDLYGIQEVMRSNPDLLRKFFVKDLQENMLPDANYLFSLMRPAYSEAGTNRRSVEEAVMDNFQDMLMNVEDTSVEGFEAAVAGYDVQTDATETCEKEESADVFEKAEVSIPGMVGWLTGMRHKTLDKDDHEISVTFDHDCMERNVNHTVCFPVVGACGRELTLPVAHMKTLQCFQDIFVMAFSKSQAFGRH